MGKELEKDPLERRIQMAGERARMEAKINDTYVVYKNAEGTIVKEYPSGETIKISEEER